MRTSGRLLLVAVLATAAALALTAPARAYLRLGVTTSNGTVVGAKWTQTIRYFISNVGVPGVSPNDLQAAAQRGFQTWASTANVTIVSQFMGFTSSPPTSGDGMTVIGFAAHPELDRVLGQTQSIPDSTTGATIESDIFLNSTFDWSVATAGESAKFDVQSIVTHEIGHLLGLGHSALGETELIPTGGRRVIAKQAVMFPIAFPAGIVLDRNLQKDDQAGIQDIYGSSSFKSQTGSINGRVTLNGTGLFGAHVIATNVSTGGLVGGFTLDDSGAFVISSLAPGFYLLRVEPLDDADVGSFFGSDTVVNLNFKVTFAPQLVAVPRGGAGATVEIKVQSK
jgi:hypothetical protein